MKTIRALRFSALLALLAMAVLLAGCKTVSVSSFQYVGGPNYAPTDPSQIQILRTPPTRPHVRLGEVRAVPSSDNVGGQKIEQSLRQAAAKMGANAVVIVSDSTQVTGAVITGPWYGRTLERTTERVVVGVAIRYTAP
jgi:ABC-type uncharacterized transport system auxiliary subunit